MAEPNRHSDPEFDREQADPLVRALIDDPRVVWRADSESRALVVGIRDELLVHETAPEDVQRRVADLCVRNEPLRRLRESGVSTPQDVAIYRIEEHNLQPIDGNTNLDSFDWATELCRDVTDTSREGKRWLPVTPNHIAVVAAWHLCPWGPPGPPPGPGGPDWVPPYVGDDSLNVVLMDTGYIPDNHQLANRGGVFPEPGHYDDLTVFPAVPTQARADAADLDGNGNLDAVAGHGTFTLGLLAHRVPTARITTLGLRELGVPSATFVTEWELARALHDAATRANVQVVLCQFAFPTLGNAIPQTIFEVLAGLDGGTTAIVAPAGNDESDTKYYPAALDRVIGVGATQEGNPRETVDFSNYGDWVDCYAGGQNVFSTYIEWGGDTGTNPQADPFDDWAVWNGTCFAAAKIAGEIAARWESHGGAFTPRDVFERMKNGQEPDLTPIEVFHEGDISHDLELQAGPGFDLEEVATRTRSQSS